VQMIRIGLAAPIAEHDPRSRLASEPDGYSWYRISPADQVGLSRGLRGTTPESDGDHLQILVRLVGLELVSLVVPLTVADILGR
jgi:hypothetical protein